MTAAFRFPVVAGSILLGLLATAGPSRPTAPLEDLPLNSELTVRVVHGREIDLWVRPRDGDGYPEIAARLTDSPSRSREIAVANDGRPVIPGREVRIPFRLVSQDLRALILLNLFPSDRIEGDHWLHQSRSGVLPTYGEGLWQVAEWYVGDGRRFEELRVLNGLASPELAPGQVIRIPRDWLAAGLRDGTPSEGSGLHFGRDAKGPYAGYRLRAGEALYSAVVVRFTGRVAPEEVETAAREIASRSGIVSLTDIPVAFRVKIPLDLLEPEFLPPGDPRRRRAEGERAAVDAEIARRSPSRSPGQPGDLVVILDPGHGGRDLGTMNHGLWEHDYVYDVACRLKRILERDRRARVWMTLIDEETGSQPIDSASLRANRQGTVRTTPRFLAQDEGDAEVALHLRWYLANSIYRKVSREGLPADRVIFLSLHADARHPSLRGAMIYVPGASFRDGRHGGKADAYSRFREVREQPSVTFTRKERIHSEAVSRQLAGRLLDALRAVDLPVQAQLPIRNRVIRHRRPWLPAVLRGNAVPAKLLIEIVNLSNSEDAALLGSPGSRETMAAALADGLLAFASRDSGSLTKGNRLDRVGNGS